MRGPAGDLHRRLGSANLHETIVQAKRKTSESALLQVEDAEENVAFLMLKPHANKAQLRRSLKRPAEAEARAFVEACLDARGIEIVKAGEKNSENLRQSGSISAEEIERRRGEMDSMRHKDLWICYIDVRVLFMYCIYNGVVLDI